MDSMVLRVAHLSDPHFSQVSFHPRQFLSKRWIGNFNLLLFRKRMYQTEHLWHLPTLLKSLKVESLFITGDLSSTSLDEEFSEGRKFARTFQENGMPVYVLPGNHDCYTKAVQKERRFYTFFSSFSCNAGQVESFPLGKGWWYIGLDCAVASPPFCSYGLFCESMEQKLKAALLTIPSSNCIIVGNHFPLFTTSRPNHDLKRAKELQTLLRTFPQVKLYLHGHDHTPYIIDRQNEGYPLVLNAGS